MWQNTYQLPYIQKESNCAHNTNTLNTHTVHLCYIPSCCDDAGSDEQNTVPNFGTLALGGANTTYSQDTKERTTVLACYLQNGAYKLKANFKELLTL